MSSANSIKHPYPVYQLARRIGLPVDKANGKQLLHYGANCTMVLGLKLVLLAVFTMWLSPAIAYLLVHFIIFFVAYSIHIRRTFQVQHSRQRLKRYFVAVISFKLFDYVAFNVLVSALSITSVWSALFASATEAVVKFVVVRRVLANQEKEIVEVPSC